MYKILVVDDEAIEREVVRFLLKKHHIPLDIQEAVNGQEALELLHGQKFDILFTDIRMPFMDGLELSHNARKLYPDIQIIFFTGYDDFSYIKEALALRVVNYILKPIDSNEFLKTITDVLKQIKNRQKELLSQKTTQESMHTHILYKLVNGSRIKQLESLFPGLDLSFAYDYHHLLLIQFEHEYFENDPASSDTDVVFTSLQNILPQNSQLINLNPAQNLILLTGQQYPPYWYQKLADTILKQLHTTISFNCYVSDCAPFSHPDEISATYESAEKQIMEQLFFAEDAPEPSSSAEPETNDAFLKLLQTDIQFKDTVNLKKHMTALIYSYKGKKNLSHIYFRFFATSILKLLLDGLNRNTEEEIDEYAKIVYRSNHMSEIESLLFHLTNQLAAKLDKERESPKYALQIVKQYIHTHYDSDLSLNILAKEVYLTPRYLSSLFIEENDCGINKYIKKVRMQKAQELLLNTNMRVSDICQAVGYSNLSYFCKSFSEEFGKTPEKFRNQQT